MNVLVIEQEKAVANRIKDILYVLDETIHVVGITDDIPAAEEWLGRNKVPDIILANNSVMSELEKKAGRDIKATVTFSTKTEELNMRAYRYKTIRHILNGLDESGNNSLHATNTDTSRREEQRKPESFKERFLVKQGQKLLSIPVEQIGYFFSEERFIFLRTFDNQKFLLDYRIEQLEELLDPAAFFRVNRSFIISIPSVKEIHAWFGNRLKLFLSPATGKEVIVSKKRISAFKSWLGK
ncbi:MAG TPA: LytTR family DNA-binding domain-containing protein [Chitinophagaceae bacterium]|nr:LytTR family DNA-binding domain-containing protein [Chitinophagaceae bacterium]